MDVGIGAGPFLPWGASGGSEEGEDKANRVLFHEVTPAGRWVAKIAARRF